MKVYLVAMGWYEDETPISAYYTKEEATELVNELNQLYSKGFSPNATNFRVLVVEMDRTLDDLREECFWTSKEREGELEDQV